MTGPEMQQTFLVFDRDGNMTGVTHGQDAAEAIMSIPPDHGILLDEGVESDLLSLASIKRLSEEGPK